MTDMLATVANMQAHYSGSSLFAFSPLTGEECSANPADYWHMAVDDVLVDAAGEPMLLAVRGVRIQVLQDA
jgi:hypothetical protein